jgi:hypothetical protein
MVMILDVVATAAVIGIKCPLLTCQSDITGQSKFKVLGQGSLWRP